MVDIQGKEIVARRLGRWRTHDLRWIEGFSFIAASDFSGSMLEMTTIFQKHDGGVATGPNFRVILRFEGVSDFQTKHVGPAPKQIVGFFIRDISDRQWERVKLLVGDAENDGFLFHCEKAAVVSCEEI